MRLLITLVYLALTINLSLTQTEIQLSDSRRQEYMNSINSAFEKPTTSFTENDLKEMADQLSIGQYFAINDERVVGDNTSGASPKNLIEKIDYNIANTYVKTLQELQTRVKVTDCCPQTQSHNCRTINNLIMPQVIFRWPYGWCYPLTTVTRRICNCNKCNRICSDCIRPGTCQPSFNYQWYPAACWSFWHWRVVFLSTYVQTGCYCDAKGC